jgi:hypothetical protein
MTTVKTLLKELESLGSEQTRKTFARHGADTTRMYGVRVGDLKQVHKKIKGEQALALELYATGNSDAMYLAGMVADGSQMTKKLLDDWAKQATWYMISEYTIPGVTAESEHASALADKWIDSNKEHLAAAGWATWAAIVSVKPDDELDTAHLRGLLSRVVESIDAAPDRARYAMNGFVIAVGSYVKSLLPQAKKTAKALGKVEVEMGDTACKVPLATEYIKKIEDLGRILSDILTLADELNNNTIDKLMAKDDAEVALDVLTGKLKL